MSKRKYETENGSSEDDTVDDTGVEQYTTAQKFIIISSCLEDPSSLFEKFNRKINRQTQQDAWNDVINRLSKSGINVPNTAYLRKRVINWVNRACEVSDGIKQTGNGPKNKLSEFHKLCLQFVRAAKGHSAVDYIKSVPEPKGTDRPSTISSSNDSEPKEKASLSMFYDQDIPSDDEKENQACRTTTKPNLSKKKQKLNKSNEDKSDWKQGFFQQMKETESDRCKAALQESCLKRYNLALRNIQLEQSLGLSHGQIVDMRNMVDPTLKNYPMCVSASVIESNYQTEFLDLE